MKFKRVILNSFILLALLISITAISAADLNDTDDMDVLKDASMNNRPYSDLTIEIFRAGSSINLESDYKYNSTYDQDCAIEST